MRLLRLGTVAIALVAIAAGCDSARKIEEAGGGCASCHGNPPPPFVAGGTAHPANADCSLCHPGTVQDDDVTLVPGGLHLNGAVEATASHDIPYVAQHPAAALSDVASCASCHGANYDGGSVGVSCNDCHAGIAPTPGFADWKDNCTFCHGTRTPGTTTAVALAAPPEAVVSGGDQTNTNPKVGAHQAHLNAGPYGAALPCSTCHAVPTPAESLTHFTGGGAQAAIAFDALATQGVTGASYDGTSCAVYCHGSGSSWPTGSVAANQTPAWTSTGLACNACHASRPATGRHTNIGAHAGAPCASCHLGYVQNTTVDPALHVNGGRSVVFDNRGGGVTSLTSPGWTDCNICHDPGPNGNVNAPPF